jgi:hypothetical protein
METTTKRQDLLNVMNQRLEQAYEDTLEDVLELLDIRKAEDQEDIKPIRNSQFAIRNYVL